MLQYRKEASRKMLSHEGFTVRPYRLAALKEYQSRYNKDNLHVLYDDVVAEPLRIRELTVDEAPRSIYRVEKLYEALEQYSPNRQPVVKEDENLRAGVALAYTAFARPESFPTLDVLPLTLDTVDTITAKPESSAGLTNLGHSKRDSKTIGLESARRTLLRENAAQPCIAYKRTQFNDKTRLVWGYPYSMTIIEGLCAWPLNQVLKRGSTPMAFAMKSGAIGTRLRTSSYRNKYAYSLDMSKYDSSLARKLIHTAFKVLKTWFDLNQVEPVSGLTVGEIFDVIEGYFIFTPIVMPDGNIYRGKRHGVPSGSYFTQMIDSVVNMIIAGMVSSRFNLNVDMSDILVLGDDLLFWSNRRVDLDDIATYVKCTIGVTVHGREKSRVFNCDEPVHFLGRDWHQGIPDLPKPDILKRMLYSESYRRYPKDPLRRQKQMHLMLLSYAATYCGAWEIAKEVLNPDPNWNRHAHEICDREGYVRQEFDVHMPDESASGLQRYLRRYVLDKASLEPVHTATQFWL